MASGVRRDHGLFPRGREDRRLVPPTPAAAATPSATLELLESAGHVSRLDEGENRLQPRVLLARTSHRAPTSLFGAEAPQGTAIELRQPERASSPSSSRSRPARETASPKSPNDLPERFKTQTAVDIGSGDVMIARDSPRAPHLEPSLADFAAGPAREKRSSAATHG